MERNILRFEFLIFWQPFRMFDIETFHSSKHKVIRLVVVRKREVSALLYSLCLSVSDPVQLGNSRRKYFQVVLFTGESLQLTLR